MSSSLSPLPSVDPAFASRLVTLADGRPGLRGGIHVDVREPSADSPPSSPDTRHPSPCCLDFVASDETLDRYDEIISAAGWKLDSYRRNPVFQNAHKYGDIIFTLGKALITEIRDGRLLQQVEFATDVNPMAKIAYGLYRGKFLNAVSVGFVPVRWENGTEKTTYRRKYLEQELLEVSAVGIPANPNALALALKSGAIEKSDIQDTLDLLRTFSDSQFKVQMASPARTSKFNVQSSAGPPPIPPISPISPIRPIPDPRLLKIARELQTILRRA